VSCDIKVEDIVAIKNSNRIHRMGDKMKPLWTEKYIAVNSLDKGHLKLQNADIANSYHTSDVKFCLRYAKGFEEMMYEKETAGEEKSSPKCQTTPQRKFNFAI